MLKCKVTVYVSSGFIFILYETIFTRPRVRVYDVIARGSGRFVDVTGDHGAGARTRGSEVLYLLIQYIPLIYSVDPVSAAQHNNSHTVSNPTIFAAKEQNGEK